MDAAIICQSEKINYLPSMLGSICNSCSCFAVKPCRDAIKYPRNLGETIRAKRIKAGLSQEKLAEKADLARNYIGNIERAEYKVTVETLARIAKALGVRVRDLVSKL